MNIFKRLFSRIKKAVKPEETESEAATEIINGSANGVESEPVEKMEELPDVPEEQPQEPKQTTLKEAMRMKYPKYADNIMKMFEAANLCEATWENLTKVRLQRLIDYMGERIAPNSVAQYATKLKAVLNLYSEEVELPRGYDKVLSPKKEKVQNVFLTEEEIQRIVAYIPKNDHEALVQAQFMIGVLTLARHSDFMTFDKSNIMGENLVYVSQKTKIQSSIPTSPTLLKFIDIQKEIIAKGVTISDKAFNATIRRICAKCNIDEPIKLYHRGEMAVKPKYEFVSSHTARRSGVTNLYLRGLDLLTISKIAGHTDTATTMNYVCCGIRELPKEAKDYFAGF